MDELLTELRAQEFARLDAGGHVYLDYTGAGLYAESQIRAHADLLKNSVLGNPHSESPTFAGEHPHVEDARQHIRDFFRADANEYEVAFTPNAKRRAQAGRRELPL